MGNLCYLIECLRQKMHVIALEKGISHPDVLRVSQRLDQVLNELYEVDMDEEAG